MGTSRKLKNKVIKRPKIIGNIEEPKANRVIKILKEVKVDDRPKRYVNPVTLNYMLKPTYLAALCNIKKKDEEWQQELRGREKDQ